MGKRGPAPAPTSLKLLKGTQADRVNRDEPLPAAGIVEKPAWLDARAAAVWDRLAPDLIDKGVLTPWDIDAFVDLCAVIVTNQDAHAEITANGIFLEETRELAHGGSVSRTVQNPAWRVVRESSAVIVTLGGRFGLNPSDRQQLSVGKDDEFKGGERLLS